MDLQNKDRTRWYGVRPGDYGTYQGRPIEVMNLHVMNNNGCTVRLRDTERVTKAVCEWITITTKVEDEVDDPADDYVDAEAMSRIFRGEKKLDPS